MKIVEKNISDLKEYENNPRNNENAVEKVAASIKQFGFKVPVVIDKDNVIVCGHTRVKAAASLEMEKVPCIVANDLNEEQIKAFRLADNKVAEASGWDFVKLEQELENLNLEGLDFTMEDFGFSGDDNFNPEEFFEDSKPKEEKVKKIHCPLCGGDFEA